MITNSGVVSTYIDGNVNTLLRYASGIAFDSIGNMYIANMGRHNILKYSNGVLSLFAGSSTGTGGSIVNGTGSNAIFLGPSGIAVHPNGNIIVVDSGNGAVRSITPGAVVSTLASGLHWPSGIAIDSTTGMIYVAQTGGHNIIKLTPMGVRSTLDVNVQLSHPRGITIDSANNLYITDLANNRIQKITPMGVVTNIAGNGSSTPFINGHPMTSTFNQPYSIAVNKTGDLYITDTENHCIRLISKIRPPPNGTDSSLLRLIKAGSIVNVDEPFVNGQVYVSANDKLLMTYDSYMYKWYVNGIMVGKLSAPSANSSFSFYPIVAMQNQSGVSSLTSGLREIGFTNLITGQYNASVGFEALPLLLGGNKNIKLKSMKTKPASFKIIKSTNVPLKDAPGKKISFRVKKQQRKSTMKRR
jgi:DNA-binding beta-propeller fold protein YncE